MGVKINGNKLIIEIDCCNQQPLAALADYQHGLTSLLHIAKLLDEHPKAEVNTAMFHSTNLLFQMLISPTQYGVLSDGLNEESIVTFNKWAEIKEYSV